ncbi:ABC transporter permease [Roseovarius pelagicus]|uniref:ABC transporter permease subunit n=1 Tax=Roseovarius pelagicus TaxID=2980108 RepID=A0ABY6D8V3_9RHOB|nr:ABC transporter permease subunit [Roseovarius pelagicus]UXX81508.1 ABC transporter permease subunit [Roseovarius pelagicus]
MFESIFSHRNTAIGLFLLAALFAALSLYLKDDLSWSVTYPVGWTLPLADFINLAMDELLQVAAPFFRGLSDVLDWPMRRLQDALHAVPWPVLTVIIAMATFRVGGAKLATFCALSCLYIQMSGYWEESLNSLTLVSVALPISALTGFLIGTAMSKNKTAARLLTPILDVMQTTPAFAYLIPLIVLLGFGPVVGLIASAIYAIPPMARNVKLGLDLVPNDLREVAAMTGCSPLTRFGLVDLPTALPQILVGLNQTIMAVLSMVVFAAIIGGFDDIGWEVLRSMRRAEFGDSLMAGIIITLIAIMLDRTTRGMATRSRQRAQLDLTTTRFIMVSLVAIFGMWGILHFSALQTLISDGFLFDPSEYLDSMVAQLSVSIGAITDALKNNVVYYFLLPIRIGLEQTISPYTWGFTFTPFMKTGYWVILSLLATFLAVKKNVLAGSLTTVIGLFVFAGTTGMPWPSTILIAIAIGYWAGGVRIAALWAVVLGVILVSGLWEPAMFSIYICMSALLFCIVLGGALGVLAAQSVSVSRLMRPILDLLQTIPPFVLLIPVVMLFQIGDFSAFLAIISYAIAPIIRYTEAALREVSLAKIEVGRSIGCTPMQLLFLVKLPAAQRRIALGVNQSIMYALAMLAVAALVGSRGLGQEVYVALGQADAGLGILAGGAIAAIAICVDRTFVSALVEKSSQSER